MNKVPMTGEESFRIIQQMIEVAKDEQHDRGDGWLIWGWILFSVSVLSAIFMKTGLGRYIGTAWTVALVVGLVIYFLGHLVVKKKTKLTKTYVKDILDRIGTGFFISLFVLVAASFLTNSISAFGYYYVLYAFWMFIYGSVLKFRPLIYGAVINWIAAISIFMIKDFFFIMVISAVAILLGYIIPGYLLRAEYNKKMQS
jgi:Flp pilus assembly protein TadB